MGGQVKEEKRKKAQDRALPDEEAPVIHQEPFLCFRISHPNIVALEDVHESPSHLYLAMEL
jgi:CaM kinase